MSHNLAGWKGRPTRSSCDRKLELKDLNAAPIVYGARFELQNGAFHTAAATAIAHPCQPNNGKNRTIKGFQNEIELIRAGWEESSF